MARLAKSPDPDRSTEDNRIDHRAGELHPSNGDSLIRSSLFAAYPHVRFGMSTRRGGVSPEPYGMNLSFSVGDAPANVRENRDRFLKDLSVGPTRLAFALQVHGDSVRRIAAPGEYGGCDGLVTNVRGIFLAVSVADCLPIFLFDPATSSVGAVHAGWRGTSLGILLNALKVLCDDQGSKPENIVAYMGPAAAACCYEIGEEVAEKFDPAFLERRDGRKPRLNLKAINRGILLRAGVREGHIETSESCTICNPDLFHSYRREGPRSGRMMGVIGIAE